MTKVVVYIATSQDGYIADEKGSVDWLPQTEQIGIGVKLYKDYGRAQRLYIHLGYVSDGYGVTYKYQPIVPGDPYPIDDDLVIWLKKDLP